MLSSSQMLLMKNKRTAGKNGDTVAICLDSVTTWMHSDSSVQHLSCWLRILCSGRFALWLSNVMVRAEGQGCVHRHSTGHKYFVSGCFLDYPAYEVVVMVVFYTFRMRWRDLVLRWRHPGVFNCYSNISAGNNCAAAWGIVLRHSIIILKKEWAMKTHS